MSLQPSLVHVRFTASCPSLELTVGRRAGSSGFGVRDGLRFKVSGVLETRLPGCTAPVGEVRQFRSLRSETCALHCTVT